MKRRPTLVLVFKHTLLDGLWHRNVYLYCSVQVEASDRGVTSRSSDVSVIVRVNDVNDNAPDISINTLSSSHSEISISNNISLSTYSLTSICCGVDLLYNKSATNRSKCYK